MVVRSRSLRVAGTAGALIPASPIEMSATPSLYYTMRSQRGVLAARPCAGTDQASQVIVRHAS